MIVGPHLFPLGIQDVHEHPVVLVEGCRRRGDELVRERDGAADRDAILAERERRRGDGGLGLLFPAATGECKRKQEDGDLQTNCIAHH